MAIQPIITIDGVDLPAPSELSIGRMDLDSPDTTRNELGFLQRDRIRQGVYKVELSFKLKTSPDIQIIERAIEGKELQVTFPTHSGKVTKLMYVGDRNIVVGLYKPNVDDIRWDMSFNLIEY